MRTRIKKGNNDLRPEYSFDYSKAVRGKYHKRLIKEGSNVIILDPDIAKEFANSAAVNDALRSLLNLTRTTHRIIKRTNRKR